MQLLFYTSKEQLKIRYFNKHKIARKYETLIVYVQYLFIETIKHPHGKLKSWPK